MRKWLEKRLVDQMIFAYVAWREACRAERDAYGSWASAHGTDAGAAFARYAAALDAEELAAEFYAGLVRRVGRLLESDHDLGPLWRAAQP